MRLVSEMFRPLVTVAIAVVTVTQLIDPPPRLPELTWPLTAEVIAAAAASVSVIDRLPAPAQGALAAVFVLSSAPMRALAPWTASVAFGFVATGSAGRQLASRRASVTIAAAGALVAMVSTWVAEAAGHSDVPPWWLCLTA